MSTNNQSNYLETGQRVVLAKKSWFAYVKMFIVKGLLGAVVLAILSSILGLSDMVFIVLWAIWMGVNTYQLSSYELYYDDKGVWLFSGIFPWNKGIRGVKWQDLDEALYFMGFFSWAMRSYNIKLAHRFTKASEIWLSDMATGDKAVMQINDYHMNAYQQNNTA